MVFCEGRLTEPTYIKALRGLPQVRKQQSLAIEVVHDGPDPLTLVQAAIKRKDHENSMNTYWCVFDVESPPRPNLDQAFKQAREAGVNLAVSNPCFELWLLLHHQEVAHTAPMTVNEAQKRSQHHDRRSGKAIDMENYLPHCARAAARALKLETKHKAAHHKSPANPSSSMHRFLQTVGLWEPRSGE